MPAFAAENIAVENVESVDEEVVDEATDEEIVDETTDEEVVEATTDEEIVEATTDEEIVDETTDEETVDEEPTLIDDEVLLLDVPVEEDGELLDIPVEEDGEFLDEEFEIGDIVDQNAPNIAAGKLTSGTVAKGATKWYKFTTGTKPVYYAFECTASSDDWVEFSIRGEADNNVLTYHTNSQVSFNAKLNKSTTYWMKITQYYTYNEPIEYSLKYNVISDVGDDKSEAKALTFNTSNIASVTENICTGNDQDWYKLTTNGDCCNYSFEFSNSDGKNYKYFRIENAEGVEVYQKSKYSGDQALVNVKLARNKTYYIKVWDGVGGYNIKCQKRADEADSKGEAKAITFNKNNLASISGSIGAENQDDDWYKFTTNGDCAYYAFEVSNSDGNGKYYRIENEEGVKVYEDYWSSGKQDAFNRKLERNKTYYIHVWYGEGNYNIKCKKQADEADSMDAATTISDGTVKSGNICEKSDVDWFKIKTTSDCAYYSFNFNNVSGDHKYFYLYNAQTKEIDYLDMNAGKSGSFNCKLDRSATYYIKVYGGAGDYSLKYKKNLDVADSMSEAKAIKAGTFYNDGINAPNDQDWYKFTTGSSHATATVELTNSNATRLDFVVYNSNKKEMCNSVYVYEGDAKSTASMTFKRNTTYYIKVVSYYNSIYRPDDLGNYSIKLNAKNIPGTDGNVYGWHKEDGNKWWYGKTSDYVKNAWKKIGKSWYRFDKAGWMQKGWYEEEGKWYYFASSGVMQTGWVKSGKSWYYMDSNGVMLKSTWRTISGKRYYFDSTGAMKTGWMHSGTSYYYFNSNGVMQTGWFKESNSYSWSPWYYANSSGVMQTGWKTINKKTYYFHKDGHMATYEWIGNYYVNGDGVWVSTRK